MRAYAIRRILLIIPTVLIVTLLVFLAVRLIPGSVIDIMVAEMVGTTGEQPGETPGGAAERTAEELAKDIRKHLGMDVPAPVQYVKWMGMIFSGDLGESLWTGKDIAEEIIRRYPISIELGAMSAIIGLLIALPVGIYSAVRQDTIVDYTGRTFAILSLSIPNFWIATMVVVYPSIWWNWTPPIVYIPFLKDPLANMGQFVLPAIINGTSMSAGIMRFLRTMMLEVLRADYVRTAWAKGLTERVVIFRHAMRNALIPIITIIGPLILIVIGGSVIMEQIFCLPGLGRYFLQGLTTRDYPIIQASNLVGAIITVTINLVIDLSYAYLDPRIVYR